MLLKSQILLLLPSTVLSTTTLAPSSKCAASALPTPSAFGASVLNVDAFESTLDSTSIGFCNITLTYTHPGQNDLIKVWLGLPAEWNMRLQGVGGGGWVTGFPSEMVRAISQGYATVATDGGHDGLGQTTESWALNSPGNVNLYALQNFASVALNDMTVLGKQITEAYYGAPIAKSYWTGCSTGGRQGLMLAQRYPTAYDGILAAAPGINWDSFIPAMFWPQWVMRQLHYFPPQCELDAITTAAVLACDQLDGLKDDIITLPDQCTFDPLSTVGAPFTCGNESRTISTPAAQIAKATWRGATSAQGTLQWPGITPGSPLGIIAGTSCTADKNCTGSPFSVTLDWHTLFIRKDPAFDPYSYSHSDWDRAFHASRQEYASVLGTGDADLLAFNSAGGKLITWHGVADPVIPFNGTVEYYSRVLEGDAEAASFYRVFAAPGVGHCGGGVGAEPTDALDRLVRWVENGIAPITLSANRTVDGGSWERELCAWPLSSIYKGGDPALAASYECE